MLVRAGRVLLNGRVIRDPETPALARARIHVDGIAVEGRKKIYLMMNKPRGLVTTASDEKGRATVYDLLTDAAWVGPVGRLDKASEGLLLFTNDSEWAAKITDPASEIEKRYHVQVDCIADGELLKKIVRGFDAGGEHLRAHRATVLRAGGKNSWIEVALDEGKNRHLRRLLKALGVEVLRLIRVSIGPLELGKLSKGTVRPLTDVEKASMDQALTASTRAV